MKTFENYRKEVVPVLSGFLNRKMAGEAMVDSATESLTNIFALTQEQRCAVKIALAYMDMMYDTLCIDGKWPPGFVGITVNLITRIIMKDWRGIEDMLKDS